MCKLFGLMPKSEGKTFKEEDFCILELKWNGLLIANFCYF